MTSRDLYKDKKKQELFFSMLDDKVVVNDKIICNLFAKKKKSGILFYPSDIIEIDSSKSKFVRNTPSLTTIGIYIFNKFCIEDLEIFGYINKAVNGKLLKEISSQMSVALMEDDITTAQFSNYIDRTQYLFGGVLGSLINVSMSKHVTTLPSKAKKLHKELLEKYADELRQGDPMISSMIEKQVCELALSEIRKVDSDAADIFDSGMGLDFFNNYRTMYVQKGAIIDNTGQSPTGYKVITSNYDTGITKEDFPKFADSLVTGAYSKGVMTAKGGYSAKKTNAMYSNIKLAPKGYDCGTKYTKRITVQNKHIYRYIMVKGKPVMLSKSNIDSYLGKTVDMRVPLYCKAKDNTYCNICHGERKYKLNVSNIGLTFNILPNKLLNADMKKFHDITIKTYPIDIEKDIMRYIDK